MKLFLKILFAFLIGVPVLLLASFSILAVISIVLALTVTIVGAILAAVVPLTIFVLMSLGCTLIIFSIID